MSNLNRARLTREQSDVQCYYAKFQMDCAFAECDEKCPILKQVYQKIRCYYAKFQLDCAFKECDEKCPILKQIYRQLREQISKDKEICPHCGTDLEVEREMWSGDKLWSGVHSCKGV